MNVVGWEMINMSEVRLYNGGGCRVPKRKKNYWSTGSVSCPKRDSFPLYVISHLSSNWKQQTSNNSPPTTCRPYRCSSSAWDASKNGNYTMMWRCGSLNALLSELFHSTDAPFSPEKPHLQWIELPPQMHLACCKYTFSPPANFLHWRKVFA